MKWIFLYTISLILEGIAVYFLLVKLSAPYGILIFFIFHVLAALLIALLLTQSLTKIYSPFSRIFLLLLGWLNFFIPGLGVIATGIIAFILLYLGKRPLPQTIKTVAAATDLNEIKPLISRYGSGGATLQLLSPGAVVGTRVEALVAVSDQPSPLTNKLMHSLLPDTQDEIRLLAFSLLSQQERFISEEISHSQQLLKNSTNQNIKVLLQKNIALLYWEIIYRQLLPEDLYPSILQQAAKYTKEALEKIPQDGALWVLLGKVYYHQGDIKGAQAALTQALDYDVAYSSAIPYLAEIDFHLHDFTALKEKFKKFPSLSELPVIGKVAQFWGHA